MDTVYVETSVIGYLTSRLSRDPVVAGHQQATRKWWTERRDKYRLVISPAVLIEIGNGDPTAAAERLEAADGIESLEDNAEVRDLAELYFLELGLPKRARVDALHIAYAVVYAADYLATWNMTHIANAETNRNLLRLNRSLGRETPIIVTVESLTQ